MPHLKFKQLSQSTEDTFSDEANIDHIKQILSELELDLHNDIEGRESIELFMDCVKKHHGVISIIDLSHKAAVHPRHVADERYCITKPLFFGQIICNNATKSQEQLNAVVSNLSILLNSMLQIHFGTKENFVCLPQNGLMFHKLHGVGAGAAAFLLKADPRFGIVDENEDAAANFILDVYNDRFIFRQVSDKTALVVHFPTLAFRQAAIMEISGSAMKELKLPCGSVSIEKPRPGKALEIQARVFIIDGDQYEPVGASANSPISFGKLYTLPVLNSFCFCVSIEKKLVTDLKKIIPLPAERNPLGHGHNYRSANIPQASLPSYAPVAHEVRTMVQAQFFSPSHLMQSARNLPQVAPSACVAAVRVGQAANPTQFFAPSHLAQPVSTRGCPAPIDFDDSTSLETTTRNEPVAKRKNHR